MATWEKNGFSIWPTWEENKMFTVLLGILMVYGIVLLGTNIRTAMQESQRVGFSELSAPTISVSATGKATVTPDIATTDIAVSKTAATSADAQNLASETMTNVITAVKALGILDADLQTSSFTTTEVYDYDVSPAVVTGYESTQTLTVKIRNTDLTSRVLDVGPANGATSVSSLRYEVDDTTAIEQEARVDAMAKARAQARQISDAMGSRIGRVVSYSESTGGAYPMYYGMSESSFLKTADAVAAPVEAGTQDIEVTVYVTYSLL